MRITDRSPTGRRLQTIFFPAEPKPVMPSEVSDEIVLTHPAIPPMVGFKEGQFFFRQVAAAAGATEVLGGLVPTDRYWWVQLAAVFHNDGVARFLVLKMRDTVPNEVRIVDPRESVGGGLHLTLDRPFLLPNDTQLVGSVDALGGANILTINFFFYELLHAEVNPHA